jgi:hypothetical protein
MTTLIPWRTAGSYFEVCNCEAICPCRQIDGKPGGRSTYGDCRFALSWLVELGSFGDVVLDGRRVVMAGWWDDDEPHTPWRVSLYVDDGADDNQLEALTSVFLGRSGVPVPSFTRAIGEVHHVRRATIALSHQRRRWGIKVPRYIDVRSTELFETDHTVTCGIPGHDQPGEEVVASDFVVTDAPLTWEFHGRCGFTSRFDYRSAQLV